jgi:hypothetical protein
MIKKKQHYSIGLILSIFLLSGCQNTDSKTDNRQQKSQSLSVDEIVQQVVKKHGSEKLKYATVSFKFRDHLYQKLSRNHVAEYQRSIRDSLGNTTIDSWIGKTVVRIENGDTIPLDIKKQHAIENSLNSVFYFGFLPQALKDPAVNSVLLGETSIKGKNYYKVKVTFDKKGGGDDHQDIFLYWINTSTFTMDYMAYQYFTNAGGMRFREANNPQQIAGIRFQDYHNYKPMDEQLTFLNIDQAFEKGKLELVSEIQLEKISIKN